jgi:hypothetical protein
MPYVKFTDLRTGEPLYIKRDSILGYEGNYVYMQNKGTFEVQESAEEIHQLMHLVLGAFDIVEVFSHD